MTRYAKFIQLLGIVLTGIGLIYGIMENDMRMEFMFLGTGLAVFGVGFLMERR